MAVCETCGNDYDKAFELVAAGFRHVFDFGTEWTRPIGLAEG